MERTVNGAEVLLLGLGLGVRHAMDADHVVVVSTLLARERGLWRAARLAALWGTGHTLAFLGVGLLVVLSGLQVPAAFERLAEVLVAVLLIGFGAAHVFGARRPQGTGAQPVAVGVVHGLAGSAGVALLAATTMPSPTLAVLYLLLVAFGTVVGMVVLTVVLSPPLAWTMRRQGVVKQTVVWVAGGLGILLGLWILLEPTLVGS